MTASEKPDIGKILLEMGQTGHAAQAIWIASILENRLEELIALYMPKLSNRMRKKLFETYGPFASFSVKIDVAYALDLIPESLKRDLHVIREVRNAFAHTTKLVHFHSDEMREILKKFPDYKSTKDPLAFFADKFDSCLAILHPQMQTLAMVKALTITAEKKPPTSKEKSAKPSSHRPPPRPGGRRKGA
jgi:hypothetical protein